MTTAIEGTDRNALKRRRIGFGRGPLAGTRTENLAWLAHLVIEHEARREAIWRWHESGYGGLYPDETTNLGTMVGVDAPDTLVFFVSVGRDHCAAWVERLRAAGFMDVQAMGDQAHDGRYPGKVRLVLSDPCDVADETVRAFIAVPWTRAR